MATIGVVLSAGRGSRLGLDLPKALVPVAGVRVVDLQMLVLSSLCDGVVIVGGYKYGLIKALVDTYGIRLLTVYNPRHREGIMLSAACAVPHIQDDDTVLRMDGDVVIYEPLAAWRSLRTLVASPSPAFAARWSHVEEDAVEMQVAPASRDLYKLLEPQSGRVIPSWAGVDVYTGGSYKDIVRASVDRSSSEPMYEAVNEAIQLGVIARPVVHWVTGMDEVDTPRDLQRVESLFDA